MIYSSIHIDAIEKACAAGRLSRHTYSELLCGKAKTFEMDHVLKLTKDWKSIPVLIDCVKSNSLNAESRLNIAKSFLKRTNKLFSVVGERLKAADLSEPDQKALEDHMRLTAKLLSIGELQVEEVIYGHIDKLYHCVLRKHKKLNEGDANKNARLTNQLDEALSALLAVSVFS